LASGAWITGSKRKSGSLLQIQLSVRLNFCHPFPADPTSVEDAVVIRAATRLNR